MTKRIQTVEQSVDLLKKTPNKEYVVQDFKDMGLFPWTRNDKTLIKLIKYDMETDNELRARIEGTGRQTRYFIKGKNIISYLERFGELLMRSHRNK